MEAKSGTPPEDDCKGGWAQCGLEMYVIQQLNQNADQRIFGIVSNGETWEFAQFQQNTFTLFNQRFDIRELDALYGALLSICKLSLEKSRI